MLELKSTISKNGTSLGIVLIKPILEMYGLNFKDEVKLELREEGVLIKKIDKSGDIVV